MTTPAIVIDHLQAMDAPAHLYSTLQSYYDGKPRLSFLSKQAKEALKDFDRINANVCRAAVLAIQERLRIAGFTGSDVWDLFLRNNLDQRSIQVHRDALLFGAGYILTWQSPRGPVAGIESPDNFIVQRDPVTREVITACKRVRTKTTTEVWLYESELISHYRANSAGATTAGFKLVDEMTNPLGAPPVAVVGHEDAPSVLADLLTLQDSIDKLLLDMMIASEAAGRPRRWATGIEAVEKPKLDENGDPVIEGDEIVMETVSPFTETENKIMIAEPHEARIGQLSPADLAGFEAGMRILQAQVELTTGMPPAYLGQLSSNAVPASAEAIKGQEAALVARVEAKQLEYGTGWERAAQLLVALRDGGNPEDVDVSVQWCPAETRSQAQEADAVTKLYQSGLLPASYALAKLGYSSDEILAIRAAKRAETLDAQGVNVSPTPTQ